MTLTGRFVAAAASFFRPGITTVEMYFLAQHHGLPTRLLDWTTNALAALFFAAETHPACDGAFFALSLSAEAPVDHATGDPTAEASLCAAPVEMRSPLLQRTIECLFGDCPRPDDPARILPILPDLSVGRMLQQGSCFTLHMPGTAELPVGSVASGNIPADCKEQILKELRMMGVSRATLFPDLDNALPRHLPRIRYQARPQAAGDGP